jgi:hypothetical protein
MSRLLVLAGQGIAVALTAVLCWWGCVAWGAYRGVADAAPVATAAVLVCLAPVPPILLWKAISAKKSQPWLGLIASSARMLTAFGALGMAHATKWDHHIFFGECLLGCYFSFLLLESALLVSWANRPPLAANDPVETDRLQSQ